MGFVLFKKKLWGIIFISGIEQQFLFYSSISLSIELNTLNVTSVLKFGTCRIE